MRIEVTGHAEAARQPMLILMPVGSVVSDVYGRERGPGMRVHIELTLPGTPTACAVAMTLGWPEVEFVGITTTADPTRLAMCTGLEALTCDYDDMPGPHPSRIRFVGMHDRGSCSCRPSATGAGA
jgi:hypothetical protein